jgi:hypothetical protein
MFCLAFLRHGLIHKIYKRSNVRIVEAISTADENKSALGKKRLVKNLGELLIAESLVVRATKNDRVRVARNSVQVHYDLACVLAEA